MFSKDKVKKGNHELYIFFVLLLGMCILFFIYTLSFSRENESFDDGKCNAWNEEWALLGESGEEIREITLPVTVDAKADEYVRIRKKIPEDLRGRNCLQLRSAQEDINVYINGVLRKKYSDKNYRWFGKSSASATIFVPIYEEDRGKFVMIEAKSGLSSYAGILNRVYVGSERGLLFSILDRYYMSYILSVLILASGVFCMVLYAIARILNNSKKALVYLSWLAIVLGIWLLCESDMRQFYFRSIISANIMAYLMIILCPIPLILFMNDLQKERYIVSYHVLISGCIINFILSTIMQIAGIADYNELLIVSHALIFLTLFIISLNIIRDYRQGLIGEVRIAGVGFGGLAVSVVAEIIYLYLDKAASLGLFLSMGILFFIMSISTYTVVEMVKDEKRQREAVMENAAKSKFLATMSHEIRTPINSVLGMNEMILRESQESNILSYSQNISRAGDMLLSIVNDILDFSKIEAGKMKIVPVNYDLGSVLNDVYQMTNVRAEEKGLQFHVNLDKTLPRGYFGDEIRIKQVITNLLTNAVKYTPEGSIEFSIAGIDVNDGVETLSIAVKDTGIGIRPEDIEHLFESFQRLDEVKNRGKEGTGLGLAITSGILKVMGSELQVESEYGKGSTFFFQLQQKIVDERPIGEITSRCLPGDSILEKRKSNFIAPKARILIVDDNLMNLEVMKALLGRTKAIVEVADSGEQALNMSRKQEYDIVFMDHMMPGMDGIETLHQMEQKKIVIALTANAISGAKEFYLQEGFDDYLTKPILYDNLEAMILRYLPERLIEECSTEESDKNLVDHGVGISYCGDDEQVYQEVVEVYCQETRKTIRRLREKLLEKDFRQYQISIHSMKSTSLTIGAIELSELAKKLEEAAKNQDMEYILENHEACLKLAEKVLRVCEEYLKQSGKEVSPPAQNELEKCLNRVQEAINEFDFDLAQSALTDAFEYIQSQ